MMADLESREIADVAAKGEKIYARLKGALEPNFNGKYVIIDTNQVNFSLLESFFILLSAFEAVERFLNFFE